METNAVVNQAGSIRHGETRWRPLYSAVAVFALTVGAGSANAGPQGGEIVAGQGNIGRAGADVTVINQQSNRLGINWDSFNVAAHETVVFQQPGSSSIALNRILDHNPSQIFGAIDANGQVFLINPSGIIFGETARVNLHSIVASSLDISTDDFMNGNYDLKALSDRAGGLVVNRGLIQAATGGSVTLVGGTVANEGLIVADYGQVNLAAGKRATLDFDGDRLMLFEISEDVLENTGSQASAVSNSGTIQADGGQVLLTGRAASDVFGSVVNNSGVIRAGRIENVGGVVRLVADSGTVLNSGNIDVSGTREGGRAELLGERVGVFGGAEISADGRTGGGTVLIGGGFQGNDPDVMNADRTYVGPTTDISADATQAGDGGSIIVWSEEVTRAYGDLSARGGAESGDGGLIETSSRDWLDVRRTPDVTAPNGDGGTWLIDPNNIAIVAAGGCVRIDNCPPPPVMSGTDFTSTDDDAQIGVDLINAALQSNGDVVIMTASEMTNMEDGNITWANGVNLDTNGGDGGRLELNAVNDISIDGNIADSAGDDDSINLVLVAGGNVSISGTISLINGTLTAGTSGGGELGGNFTHTGMFSGSGMSVFANGDLTMQGSVTIGGAVPGAVDLNAGQANSGSTIMLDFMSLTGATATTVSGGGGVDVFTVAADLTAALSGGGGRDEFTLTAGTTLTGAIDGDTGPDILTGGNAMNSWELTGAQTGTVTGVSGGFSGIRTVVGGSMVDNFTVTGAWGGFIQGGDGNDNFTLDGGTVGQSVNGQGGGDTLTADNVANTWALTNTTTGTVTGVGSFSDILNVVGGSDTDDFTITGPWVGNVSGGLGADTFTISNDGVTNLGAVGGAINGDGGLIVGADGTNTLTAANTTNMWTLTGAATGTVTGVGMGFSNINAVVGGTSPDTFTVTGMGTWAGSIAGGASLGDTLVGADIMNNWILSGFHSGTLNGAAFSEIGTARGGSMVDNFSVTGAFGTTEIIPAQFGRIEGMDGADVVTVSGAGAFTVFDGGTGTDTIIAPDLVNSVELTASSVGTIENRVRQFFNVTVFTGGSMTDNVTISGAWSNNVNGGDGADFFTLDGGSVGGTINGGDGTDTIVANNTMNTWTITGDGAGDVNSNDFTGIESATGGSDTDNFVFQGGAGVLNAINGAGGTDTIDWTMYGSAIALVLAGDGTIEGFAGSETTTVAGGFDNVENLLNTGLGDSFTAPDTANTWDLDGTDDFTLNGVAWTDFANVIGGALTDDFTVSAAWAGNVSGGLETDTFTLTTGSVGGMIDGDGGTNTLTAANDPNTWALTGPAAGMVTGTGGFTNITNIVGGSNTDAVTVSAAWGGSVTTGGNNDQVIFNTGGSIAGAIDGGAGSDTLNWSGFDAGVSQGIDLVITGAGTPDGFAGSEASSAAAGFDGFNVFITTAFDDTFTAPDTANIWDLNGPEDFMLNGVQWNGFTDVFGGTMTDQFTVSAAFGGDVNGGSGNGSDTFTLTTGTVGGAVRGGAGTDTLTAANVPNTWSLTGGVGGSVTGVGGNFVGIENIVGGTNTDNVTVSAVWTNNVTTGDGNDSVILTAGNSIGGMLNLGADNDGVSFAAGSSVGGPVDGGSGTDTLDWSGYGAAIAIMLTDPPSIDGAAGSAAPQAGGATIAMFDNINNVLGSGLGDSLTAADILNTWDLNGPQNFLLNTVQWDGFATVTGGSMTDNFTVSAAFAGNVFGSAGNDTFLLTTGSIGGALDGGTGTDTLTAANGMNAWALTGPEAGTVTGITGGFTAINNVVGGSMTDAYTVTGAFAGNVSGGDGDDTFALTDGLTNGTIGGLLDGGSGTNLLTAANTINTWVISGATAGTVTGIAGGFTGITNVTGGAAADGLLLTAAFGGAIDGGLGVNSLTAANTINTWDLTGASAGTVTGVAGGFTNISNVTGGSMTDTIGVTGMWAGNVSGGGGDDAVNFSGTGDVAGTVSGNDGNDSVSFAALAATRNLVLGDGTILTVENFTGNGGALTGDNLANNWLLNAMAGGSVTNTGGTVTFDGFSAVIGGTEADMVTVAAGNTWAGTLAGGAGNDAVIFGNGAAVAGAVDGGAGTDTLDWSAYSMRTVTLQGTGSVDGQAGMEGDSIAAGFDNIDAFITSGMDDTLIAADIANEWIVNGVDAFTLNSTAYTGFANLVGGANTDDFTLSGGSVTGSIDGAGGVNTLTGDNVASTYDISGAASGNTAAIAGGFSNITNVTGGSAGDVFNITSNFTGTLAGGAGNDQFNLQGGAMFGGLDGGAGSDTLTASNGANTWLLTDAGVGSINGQAFTSFEAAVGGSAVDTITVSGAYGGVVDAGAGNDIITIATGGAVSSIQGGDGTDSLTAGDGDDTFIVDGSNSGSLNGTAFAAVENLDGAGGNDAFTVASGAAVSLAGMMSGGTGNDTLTVDYSGAASRTLTFDGGADTDMLVTTGGGAGFAGSYNAGTSSLDYTGGGNTQSVNASNIESVTDTVVADSLVVNGTAGDDTIELGTGTAGGTNPLLISLAGGTPIDTANNTDVTIDGAGGADAVNIASDITVPGTLELNAETVTSGGGTITAALLRLVGTAMAGVNNALLTAIDTLQITGGSGEFNIDEADGIALAASDTTGAINITADGAMTQTGAVTAAGGAALDAASITLANAGNDFGGSVALTSSGDATIVDQNVLVLGTAAIGGNLSAAAAAGDLSGAGPVSVGGTTALSATGGDVVFDDAANSFAGLVTVAGGNNATLTAGSPLALGASNVTGNYSATSTGSIELQQLLAAGGNVSLLAGGTLSETGAGAITGNALTVQGAGGITLDGANAVSGFNATNAGGALAFTNTGNLTISGISQSGNGAVTLKNAGSVSMPGTLAAAGGNVSIDATQAFSQGASIMAGGGAITVNAGTGINMTGTAVTTTAAGDIVYCTQTGDVLLGLLDAGSGNVEVKTVGGNLFSINGVGTDNITGTDVVLDASGAIGSQAQSIQVNAPGGNAGKITIRNTGASQVFLANVNNTGVVNETTSQIIDFGAAAAIAAFQAGQSSTLQDVGFVDLALFSPDVTLINTVGAGVLMPCDQLDDEEARCQ